MAYPLGMIAAALLAALLLSPARAVESGAPAVEGAAPAPVPSISMAPAGMGPIQLSLPGLEAPAAPASPATLPELESPRGDSPAVPAAQPPALTAASPAALPSGRVEPPAAQASAAAHASSAAKPSAYAQAAHAAAEPGSLAQAADGGRPLDVMIVAAEAVPFIKTGGLADVVDAVGRGLVKDGHKVTLVLPNYANNRLKGLKLQPAQKVAVPIGNRVEHLQVLKGEREGVEIWLLDGALFNSRDGPYAQQGQLHADNDERFIALSRGALEAAKAAGRKLDVVHAHDWHAALVAPYLKLLYKGDPHFARTKSVVTIHNLAYQGEFAPETTLKAGFGWEHFTYDGVMHWDKFNFLKAGLQFADKVTTVSRNYAKEIETQKYGAGLETLLQWREKTGGVAGIVNGVDRQLYAPETDPHIPHRYGVEDAARGKAANKAALQAKTGLAVDASRPLFAVASRFDHQKGIDLVLDVAPDIVASGGQLIVSGFSDPHPQLDALIAAHPDRVFRHGFSETFVRELYAASDFLLMFSRFEPCGLSQLIAQIYGTIPVVTPTGGLVDTVTDVDADHARGDGLFLSEFSREAALAAVRRAEALFQSPDQLAQARKAAMTKDSSWGAAIREYVSLFRSLL